MSLRAHCFFRIHFLSTVRMQLAPLEPFESESNVQRVDCEHDGSPLRNVSSTRVTIFKYLADHPKAKVAVVLIILTALLPPLITVAGP